MVNRYVRAYRESRLPRTHVRSKTPKFSFIGGIKNGSCSPAIGGEVGLHKGFDAHKAPDTPPGRVDDVVGGFQITSFFSATGKSTSCRSPRMDFLPPSGGVFRLSHFGIMAGYPMQTVMWFSRSNGQNGNKKAVTKQTSPAFAFSGRSC